MSPSSPNDAGITPRGAHLVGSINLADAETVMRTVSGLLGPQLRRIPDGEVGERYYWIQFQRDRLAAADGIERVGEAGRFLRGRFDARPLRLAPGASAGSLRLPPLGYADAALDSYNVFRRLRQDGLIRLGTRFQVSLPTPAAVIASFVVPEDRAQLEPVYQRALFAELDRILAGIPHGELAVQWDTAAEFGLLESDRLPAGYPLQPWFDDVLGGVVQRAARQAAVVPEDVEVGYHLCYGDVEEAHFVQPEDTGHLAAVASRLLARASRPITWIHLPVPVDRDDDDYFRPLAGLSLPEDTELYLGVVHHEDGIAGARRRIRAASRVQRRFGVATECGFGRGPAERTAPLLRLHAELADAW